MKSTAANILVYRDQDLKEIESDYWNDPEAFIWDVLGVRGLFVKVCEFIWSVAQNRKTVARGCYGSAKTFYLACIVLWFLYTRYNSRVVTTAPTARQVRDLLWAEINALYQRRPGLGGRMLQNRLIIAPKWGAIGMTANQSNESAMQGYHGENVLVAMDEASGIRAMFFEVAERLAVGSDDRIVAIGNAIDPLSYYASLFKASDWAHIVITAFDTPNVAYKKEIVRGMVSWEWVEEKRKKWGENSQLYKSRVMAEFPTSADNAMIPLAWIEAAMQRYDELIEEVRKEEQQRTGKWACSEEQAVEILRGRWQGNKSSGIDIAGSGDDNTVFADRIGNLHLPLEVYHGLNTQEIAGMAIIKYRNGYELAPDATTLGAGVVDPLEAASIPLFKVIGAERSEKLDSTGSFGFTNKRTELYWTMREVLSPDLSLESRHILPRDPELLEELALPMYSHVVNGKVKMENKEQVKARLGRSPDRADATVNSLAAEGGAFAFAQSNSRTTEEEKANKTPSNTRGRSRRKW